MIVRDAGNRLLLITQPDHARLAAEIIEQWKSDGFPTRPSRALVLLATREHDNGWIEPDAEPCVDPQTRRPYDFISAPDAVRQAVWPRALGRIGSSQPYVGALIAEHALTVYGRLRTNSSWSPFFQQLEMMRDRLLRISGSSGAEQAEMPFERDYALLFLGDLLSLAFCNGWSGHFEARGYDIAAKRQTLHLSPDPFDGATVHLGVMARQIPARPYESDRDLQAELTRAEVVRLAGTVVGTPGRIL